MADADNIQNPVLLIGGYGVLGRQLARTLRKRNPRLPLVIAGRDVARASAFAAELGDAKGVAFELDPANAPLPDGAFSAVVLLVKDETLRVTDAAGKRGIPLITCSTAAFEVGPDLFHGLRARGAPVVLGGHWFAGAPTIVALALSAGFSRVDEIDVGLVIDRSETGSGPATAADFERIASACPSTLIRTKGRYRWVQGHAARASFEREDGSTAQGSIAVSTDVLSLTAASGASSVRVIEAFTPSLSLQRGKGAADEVNIRVSGIGLDGKTREVRQYLTASRSGAPLTALTLAVAIERLTGELGDQALAPGLYPLDATIDPNVFVAILKKAGVRFSAPSERRAKRA